MFINFKEHNLELGDLELLTAMKQNETDWLIQHLSEASLNRLEALGFISRVKPKNKQSHPYSTLRLSTKAKDFFTKIDTPEVEEQDIRVKEWLVKHYTDRGKDIGNKKKLERHIRDFRIKSGIEKNCLIALCVDFLRENEERSNKLEYVFYRPKTAFETRFDLEESWLYQHYIKNKERLDQVFEKHVKS